MTLRDHMRDLLEEGWTAATPEDWREIFGDVGPDFDARFRGLERAHDVARPAFPSLQAIDRERHLFRAFQDITPAQVRVVVIGQDP